MRDVAELAGVAPMTVSRVLNNSAPVTEETRARVHRAIKELNYRPNQVARSLRQSRSRSIGIIVPNFYDPFFSACAHAISLVAKAHEYSVNVTTSDEDAGFEFTEANLMVLNHVEGLAVIPAAFGESRFEQPEFDSTHVVAFDRPIAGERFSNVLVENQQGAKMAVEHLLEHGHTSIAYLGLSDTLYTIGRRYEGYLETMQQAGLTPHAYFTCQTQENTCAVIQRAMSEATPVTAFFAGNNLVMRHALHAFSSLRIDIPGDVAVIGFDDFEMADIFQPPVTVVRQPTYELGRVAAELLFSNLKERELSTPGRQVILPVELILRESCGCKQVKMSRSIASARKRR